MLLRDEGKPLLSDEYEALPFPLKPFQGSLKEKIVRRRQAKNRNW
jgi:hypothetical protein